MRTALAIIAIILLALLSSSQLARGQFSSTNPYTQVTLDKPYYYPGDPGKLSIDIKDTLSLNIEIYNISIIFPWRAYINGHWDGNQTLYLNQPVASGSWLPTVSASFTMPSDSRYTTNPFFFGQGGGMVTIWANGVGPNGGPGFWTQNFLPLSAFYFTSLDWHTIVYALFALTSLVGVMTGAVLYYVFTSRRPRGAMPFSPPPTPSGS